MLHMNVTSVNSRSPYLLVCRLRYCGRLLFLVELVHAEHLLERGTGANVVPPSRYMRPGRNQIAFTGGGHKQLGVWEVRKISQTEEITRQILVVGKVGFIHIKYLLKLRRLLSNHVFVAGTSEHAREYSLIYNLRSRWVEVLRLDLHPLTNKSLVLHGLSKQWCALPLKFLSKVSDDGTRLCVSQQITFCKASSKIETISSTPATASGAHLINLHAPKNASTK